MNLLVQNRDISVVSENLKRIICDIEQAKAKYRKPDDDVRVMAVTKTVDVDSINFVIENGITLLGENRVQEYLEKYERRFSRLLSKFSPLYSSRNVMILRPDSSISEAL